jgi:ATP:corrinoid adenosyltransferase
MPEGVTDRQHNPRPISARLASKAARETKFQTRKALGKLNPARGKARSTAAGGWALTATAQGSPSGKCRPR